jgi:DNA-binding transcriptional ArsR family regulator
MTTPLDRRLQRARDRFITEIVHAIECAIIDAIEEAFAAALARRPRLAMSSRPSKPVHRAAPPPPAETPSAQTTRDRVLASIRDAPGSHIGELSQLLAMPASTVRRHLRQLAATEAIRIEGTADPRFAGQRLQTFFPCAPESVGSAPSASAAEASA